MKVKVKVKVKVNGVTELNIHYSFMYDSTIYTDHEHDLSYPIALKVHLQQRARFQRSALIRMNLAVLAPAWRILKHSLNLTAVLSAW